MEKEELDAILESHKEWLMENGGKRADLRGADLCDADLRRADLRGADLRYASLRGADLYKADLRDANLRDVDVHSANLEDDVITLDRIGSCKRRTIVNLTTDTVWCGCFTGSLDEFEAKCRETHGETVYGKEYAAAIKYIREIRVIHEEAMKEAK